MRDERFDNPYHRLVLDEVFPFDVWQEGWDAMMARLETDQVVQVLAASIFEACSRAADPAAAARDAIAAIIALIRSS